MKKNTYTVKEKVWLYPGDTAAWHFITLPKIVGKQIKEIYGSNARGFGSLPVEVTIMRTIWKTSIFPDKYSGSYILPLKAKVRKQEEIEAGDQVTVLSACYNSTHNLNTCMAKGMDRRKEVKKPKKDKVVKK